MKRLLLLLFLFCISKVYAQTDITKAISGGFELAIPANSVYNVGTGFSIKGELPIVTPVSLSLTAGFTAMFYKSNLFNSSRTPGAAGFLPLKAGVKYYWLGAGSEDMARAGTVALSDDVKQIGFNTSYKEIPGIHYWFLWRDFLGDYTQVLFK